MLYNPRNCENVFLVIRWKEWKLGFMFSCGLDTKACFPSLCVHQLHSMPANTKAVENAHVPLDSWKELASLLLFQACVCWLWMRYLLALYNKVASKVAHASEHQMNDSTRLREDHWRSCLGSRRCSWSLDSLWSSTSLPYLKSSIWWTTRYVHRVLEVLNSTLAENKTEKGRQKD